MAANNLCHLQISWRWSFHLSRISPNIFSRYNLTIANKHKIVRKCMGKQNEAKFSQSVTGIIPTWLQHKGVLSGYLLTKNDAIPQQPLKSKNTFSLVWIVIRWAYPQREQNPHEEGGISSSRWTNPHEEVGISSQIKWANPHQGGQILILI